MSRLWRTLWRTMPALVLAILAFAALVLVADPRPAAAMCAKPSPSPYRFTGTVVGTGNDDRLATVRTDDGRTVVIGTEDAVPLPYQRRYEVGVRYEFHPTNDASPYLDSMCTETHEIGAKPPPGTAVAWLRWAVLAVLGAGTAVVAVVIRRRRRPA